MKFLVDVNIGVSVVDDLRAAGHDVVYVAAIDERMLKRSKKFTFPPLSDKELVLNAEEIFLELDQRESENRSPQSK